MKKWYVVHTYSGQEGKVKAHLEMTVEKAGLAEYFGEILMPTREVVSVTKGKKISRDRKNFPSYVIVEMEMNKETLHFVTDVPGVTHFVGVGKPQPIRPAEIERILGQEKTTVQEDGKVEIPYLAGDNIRIKDGPFKDFDGLVEEVNPEKGKIKVLVSVFGRSTPVELDFIQVEAL
ncbi:MAG: transcription termination/antitermination factor NusG [Fibrobacteria bacterium]|nr:transcription termination/antitermination factor NusG [Fibrobacteria bacterium]